jgi:acyl-[acyl-carrier-protein]-phospholipid O-acyltransferase/long-chain-fatty-acid--[acyl-carrier-protein] ligase
MATTKFDAAAARATLFGALLDARDRFGAKTPALEDPERNPLTYGRLVLGALVLGRKLAPADPAEGAGRRSPAERPGRRGGPVRLERPGPRPGDAQFTAGVKTLSPPATSPASRRS